MMEERIGAVLEAIGGLRIGVLGDFAIDAYWMLEDGVGELSVETGKRALVVRSQRYSLGGAGNTVANLAALRPAGLEAFGVRGADLFGRELVELLERLGVETGGIVVQREGWDTHVWSKPHLEGEEQRRLDFGFHNELSDRSREALFNKLEERLPSLDALIVNQQLPRPLMIGGCIDRLNELAAAFPHKLILADVRRSLTRFRGIALKFNEVSLLEARQGVESLGPGYPVDRGQIVEALENLFAGCLRPIVVTRGKRGGLVWSGDRAEDVPGVQVTGPVDPVGAGDTMVAALTTALAAGLELPQAALLGNFAAAVTVRKLRQTGTASPEEILRIAGEGNLVVRTDLAEDPRQARYLPGTRIELVGPEIVRGQILHAVFDHDGTISVLRQGWEPIMEEVMLESILGAAYRIVSSGEFHRLRERVREFIDQTTGIQTIIQMQGLVEMVREFGYVPADQVLDPLGYKALYNVKLLEMVDRRLECLERGELEVEDFTMKGAVGFVFALRERGLHCYLASGTDEEDVLREAGRLGYAAAFDGGIYGSVGDLTKFSKRKLIARIMTEHGLEGPQLCTFGDGPVEIRESKRRGGIAVGIASDEVRRYGIDLKKRERLIRAGADLIIEDYTQAPLLLAYLLGQS